MTAIDISSTAPIKGQMDRLFLRKRVLNFALPLVILAYLSYVFFAFDVPGLSDRVSLDNARTLVADSYSYKTHVTRDNRNGEVSVAIEGERKGAYAPGTGPEWVSLGAEAGDTTRIDLGAGHEVRFGPETVEYDIPGYGLVRATPSRSAGVEVELPEGPLPEWISMSKNRLAITTDAGRLTVTRNRAEVFRYFFGWELFFFTLDSPYSGMGPGQLLSHAINGEAGAIWHDFWQNSMWRHADVAWALGETILMAFLGTFGAGMIALPLAFLGTRNFMPVRAVRFVTRRLFDFVRGSIC